MFLPTIKLFSSVKTSIVTDSFFLWHCQGEKGQIGGENSGQEKGKNCAEKSREGGGEKSRGRGKEEKERGGEMFAGGEKEEETATEN